MKLTSAIIKRKALNIGFDLVGITDAEPLSSVYQYLEKRKNNDSLPDLLTDDIGILITPAYQLPEARSIIAVAISYAGPEIEYQGFQMSSYTSGKDYHPVMEDKMERLVADLKRTDNNFQYKIGVDTIPLLEREIARKAGLGWIGKNTNLINIDYGSYLFLGEIITDLELERDQPVADRCGDCELCIEHCNGSALKAPYYLDSENCISYITQKKGVLTGKESELMGLHFWGCDRCQQVCPYNSNIPRNLHSVFTSKIEPDVERVLNLQKNDLPGEWQDAALSWRGLQTLKRNALIVIGNSGNTKYIPVIKKYLKSSSPVLKKHAERAYNKIKSGGI